MAAKHRATRVKSLSLGTRLRILFTLNATALAVLIAVFLGSVFGDGTVDAPRMWLVSWAWLALLVAVVVWWQYRRAATVMAVLTGAIQDLADDRDRDRLLALGAEYRELTDAFNDMSARVKERQRRLQETVDRRSTVLGAMEEGVIAVDDRQRILFANQAAGKLLGFDAKSSVGKQMLEIIRNHMLHEAVSETLANQEVPDRKLKRYELNGDQASSNQLLSLHTTPLPGDPCPGVVMVLEDISELRRLEQLRQEFVANVSHELKTPLTAIKAYAETLAGGAIEDRHFNRKFLGQIEIEADRLHDLIIDMLRLAQIESGHELYEIGAVNLAKQVSECLDRHEAAAQRKRIALISEGGPLATLVRADQDGLREIINNLIDNAIKYNDPGGTVTITWRCEADADRVQLIVRDTGVGIPQEALGRVFERFYRVDRARSRELGSTGLGLSIVKHIVNTFGGSVSAESEEGKGSCFTVQLRKA